MKSNQSPGEIEVWNDIYNGNVNAEFLVYGSSRAWVHVDPQIIEDSLGLKAYNFGMDGQNFALQYLRHKKFLKYNKKPKKILVCVDIFSFQKAVDLYEMNQFLPFMLYDFDIFEYTSKYNGYNKLDYFFPLIRYYGKISGKNSVFKESLNSNIRYRKNGYKGIVREWTNDFEIAKSKSKKLTIKNDEILVELFDLFLSECKEKNIDVILVYTPEFIEGQKYVTNRNDIINQIDALAKKFNIIFIDYSNDEICLDKTYFYNATHLNYKGSKLFSKKLASDLKLLIEE